MALHAQYVTLYFRDRRDAAPLRHKNCAEITVLMCDLEALYRQPLSFSGAYTVSCREGNAAVFESIGRS